MATKTKDSSNVVGKEKKTPPSNIPITSTKKTTKPPSMTSTTEKPTKSPSEKQVPNYLKPTVSSRLESNSFKLSRSSTDAPNKPTLNRRRSFDKPPSPSRLPKQQQPTLSRQHKALVSPGPRVRSLNRSTTLPVKSTNPPSKPISKIPKEGKTVQPLVTKKSSPSHSTSTTKKVADDASANSKNTNAEKTTEVINVETEQEVKEAIINEENIGEVEKVENQEHEEVESVISDIPPHHVDSESEQNHDESDQPHIQDDDNEKVIIPTVLSTEQEEIKDEQEEDHELNTNKEECNNINESDHKEINHSTTEGEVEVIEKKEEGGIIIEEDHKNNEEEKERVEGGTSEGVESMEGEEEHEEVVESEVKDKEAKVVESITEAKQQVQGKKECHPQVSNDVIEETASKLLMEERKNKVRALAGAFQTVIDYQTK